MIAKLQRSLVEKGAMSRVRCSTKVSLRKLHKNWDIKKNKVYEQRMRNEHILQIRGRYLRQEEDCNWEQHSKEQWRENKHQCLVVKENSNVSNSVEHTSCKLLSFKGCQMREANRFLRKHAIWWVLLFIYYFYSTGLCCLQRNQNWKKNKAIWRHCEIT